MQPVTFSRASPFPRCCLASASSAPDSLGVGKGSACLLWLFFNVLTFPGKRKLLFLFFGYKQKQASLADLGLLDPRYKLVSLVLPFCLRWHIALERPPDYHLCFNTEDSYNSSV